jgi:hypothetical protein
MRGRALGGEFLSTGFGLAKRWGQKMRRREVGTTEIERGEEGSLRSRSAKRINTCSDLFCTHFLPAKEAQGGALPTE